MKRKRRNESVKSPVEQKAALPYRKMLIFAVAVLGIGAIIYYLLMDRRSAAPSVLLSPESRATIELKPDVLFGLTVDRALAIDQLFQQVYNNGWEAANGAIGEAFLYAATDNAGLLNRYTTERSFMRMSNGTWVDDRAWICLAELYWYDLSGKHRSDWVADAKQRYDEARSEGRLSNHEGFWSWYNWAPDTKDQGQIMSNSNTNQMVTVACKLFDATGEKRYYNDALLVWEGDSKFPGIEKTFYRGEGKWEGKGGMAAFGKQLPWEEASYLSVVAAMYRMTGKEKYKNIAIESARRILDPANNWVDANDYYQRRMDGNGAFVHFLLDAYLIAPNSLADIPLKVGRMLEHVWSNHHGAAVVLLHRLNDNAIRNGWNPSGGEEGYGVDQIGTVHAQSQAMRAFGVYAYVLRQEMRKQ